MQTFDVLAMFIALMLGTQLCRFLPLVIPKSALTHPILQKLNKSLPLVIMMLLVFTSVSLPKAGENYHLFAAQIAAIVVVLISYRALKNTLLSVVLGIVSLNAVLWLISYAQ